MKKIKNVILGAGLTGLSSAYEFEKRGILDWAIFEKESFLGGLCSSFEVDNYIMDYTGHALHLKSEKIKNLILDELDLKDELDTITRKAAIFYKKRFIPYPFQLNLYYLPIEERIEALTDFIEAYKIKDDNLNGINFYQFCLKYFGKAISEKFMFPYNEKLWATSPKEMGIEWMGRFVPKIEIKELIERSLKPGESDVGYNASFYYPKKGGIDILPKRFAEKLPEESIFFQKEVVKIDIYEKYVEFKDKERVYYDNLINTIPLSKFVELSDMSPNYKFRNTIVRAFFIEGDAQESFYHTWLYIPDRMKRIYRIGNFNKFKVPENRCKKDFFYVETSAIDETNLAEWEEIKKELEEIGVIENFRLLTIKDINPAYVVYDINWGENIGNILTMFKKHDVYTIGRYGAWKYDAMEGNILDGIATVSAIVGKG